jgi:hypothetical protein
MGLKSTYNASWDSVYDYLQDPCNVKKHRLFYAAVEPLIRYWLLRMGLKENLEGHTKSIFSDLYLKEQKRYKAGKLVPEKCSALITTYYYPVIKNLCIDYVNILNSKIPSVESDSLFELEANPGVFEALWGEHRNTVLLEMRRSIKDWIELSSFEPSKKEYLRKRFIEGLKFPDIFNGVEKAEFEAHRKWTCRQGKKIALIIARSLLPAIIDCYRIPISKKIDPKIIEKHLLGIRTKMAI